MEAQDSPSGDVTVLLEQWRAGDEQAFESLLPLVYEELRRVAAGHFRSERRNHTLQPTEVLHEAYLRLARPGASFENRAHFFAAAARSIRQVLVDYARRRNAAKRPDGLERVTLLEAPASGSAPDVEVLALNEALERLESISKRQAEIVELRYFAGLTREEIADSLGVSVPTVSREWRVARILLRRWLAPAGGGAAADS